MADYTPRLQTAYEDQIRKAMVEKHGYKNPHQIPALEKITLNMGVGKAIGDKKILDLAYEAMTQIAGQKPVMTTARKSIANFRLREGMPIGCMVTLRRQRMFEFLDRLVSIVLPRVRDFRGLKKNSCDGRGNYALGLKEHIVFPEINYDKVDQIRGMDIVICTSAQSDDEARALLKEFKLPIKD